jgi:hypothetical protein
MAEAARTTQNQWRGASRPHDMACASRLEDRRLNVRDLRWSGRSKTSRLSMRFLPSAIIRRCTWVNVSSLGGCLLAEWRTTLGYSDASWSRSTSVRIGGSSAPTWTGSAWGNTGPQILQNCSVAPGRFWKRRQRDAIRGAGGRVCAGGLYGDGVWCAIHPGRRALIAAAGVDCRPWMSAGDRFSDERFARY